MLQAWRVGALVGRPQPVLRVQCYALHADSSPSDALVVGLRLVPPLVDLTPLLV